MKKFIYIIATSLAGCATTPELIVETQVAEDSTSVAEAHFNCFVTDCRSSADDAYWITTECGVVFYSKYSYKPNTALHNFKSPKHQ